MSNEREGVGREQRTGKRRRSAAEPLACRSGLLKRVLTLASRKRCAYSSH
jgi:hypothetical protein